MKQHTQLHSAQRQNNWEHNEHKALKNKSKYEYADRVPHNTKIAAHNPENRRSHIQIKNYINITDAAAIGGAFYSSGIKTPDALIGERQYRYRYPFNDTLIWYNHRHKLLKKRTHI
jgi:hypothetical protein